MELADRVVVVTGAASGIGAALARRFCAEGAKVVAADLDADRLAGTGTLQVVTDVAEVVGDVLEPSDVAEMALAGIREERLDLLPHPEVAEYVRRRAEDPERWVRGMRRLAASVTQATPEAPQP